MPETVSYADFLAHLDRWKGESVLVQTYAIGHRVPLVTLAGTLGARYAPTSVDVTAWSGPEAHDRGIAAFDVGTGTFGLNEDAYDHGTLEIGVDAGMILRAFTAPRSESPTMLSVVVVPSTAGGAPRG